MKLLTKWLVCIAAFVLAYGFFPGHVLTVGGALPLVAAGTVLWLVNLILRPVAQLISLPVTLLTFGLFSIVVNALMVCLTDSLISEIRITSFWICLFIAIVISIANTWIGERRKT